MRKSRTITGMNDTAQLIQGHSGYSACAVRIAYVVGARPNFVKMAQVISDRSQIGQRRRIPDGGHALIHTGQHYDRLMWEIFLEDLIVAALDNFLGDVTSTLAATLVGVELGIPVAHPESNLSSFERTICRSGGSVTHSKVGVWLNVRGCRRTDPRWCLLVAANVRATRHLEYSRHGESHERYVCV
jgi:hypothetical protein